MTATARPKLCIICGGSFPTTGDRDAHREREHPGYRTGWGGRKNREPKIIAPDGTETIVPPAEYQRMRRASLKAAGPAASFAGAPEPVPLTDAPPAGEAGSGAPSRPAAPFVVQPPLRLGQAFTDATARDLVGRELTAEVLADLIRQLSEVISEMDGAGPDGVFSPIQSRQLAMLLHDATVDLVVARFAGNVSRFKLGMAAAIIIIGKGRVHAAAIGRTIASRRVQLDDGSEGDEPELDPDDAVSVTPPPPPPPVPVDEPEPEPAPLPVPPVVAQDLGAGVAGRV